MWMVRLFFMSLSVFLGVLLIVYNQELLNSRIEINFLVMKKSWSPFVAMLFAFAAGFLTWFIVSMFNYLKIRSQLESREKLIKNLKRELNDYRNSSLTLPEGADKTQVMGVSAADEDAE